MLKPEMHRDNQYVLQQNFEMLRKFIVHANTLKNLYYCLTILFVSFLSACSDGCSSNSREAEDKKQANTNGCVNECTIGITGCNANGEVVACIQGAQGCGIWDVNNSSVCTSDLICYSGQCIEEPNVPYPSFSSNQPEDFWSLYDRSTTSYPLEHPTNPDASIAPNVLVIPLEAFLPAIQGRYFSKVSSGRLEQGARILERANDMNILGLQALYEETNFFEGDLFIVTMDATQTVPPSLNALALSNADKHIESKRYFIVAAEGLSGTTSWVGRSPSLLGAGQLGLPSGSCCGGASTAGRICGLKPPTRGPIPVPPSPCLTNGGGCPGFTGDLPINTLPGNDPYRLGTGTKVQVDPTGLSDELMSRGNGLPGIFMYSFDDRPKHDSRYQPGYPHPGINALIDDFELVPPSLVACDYCSKTRCLDEPQIDFEDAVINQPGLPNDCGVQRENVPALCTIINGNPSGLPFSCGGICNGCEGGGNDQPYCAGALPTGKGLGIGDTTSLNGCNAPKVPAYCAYAGSGSDCYECDSGCQQAITSLWNDLLNCGSGAPAQGSNASCCDAGSMCTCVGTSGGPKMCTTCNEQGACGNFVLDPLYDERYFHNIGNIALNDSVPVTVKSDAPSKKVRDENTPENPAPNPDSIPNDTSMADSTSQSAQEKNDPTETPPTQPIYPTPVFKTLLSPAPSSPPVDKPSPGSNPIDVPIRRQDEPFNPRLIEEEVVDNQVRFVALPPEDVAAKKRSEQNNKPKPQTPTKKAHDPIDVSSGSFLLEQTDINLPGPVRSLEFTRYYDSQTENRSILGSNWTHTYDAHVEPIRSGNMESWMPLYCASRLPITSCALVYDASGAASLFVHNPHDANNLFYPQAGGTSTLQYLANFWTLHTEDGHVKHFNALGSLVEDRDRYGNGFIIEYEDTPFYHVYSRYCDALGSKKHQEKTEDCCINCNCVPPSNNGGVGPEPGPKAESFDPRMCQLLANNFGDIPLPSLSLDGWKNIRQKLGPYGILIEFPEIEMVIDQGIRTPIGFMIQAFLNNLSLYRDRLADDRAYVEKMLNHGPLPQSPTGTRRQRPVKVTDDLGRQLRLYYHEIDPEDLVNYGLLASVVTILTPGQYPIKNSQVIYTYDRPKYYPLNLQESFLIAVEREDLNIDPENANQLSRARKIAFRYNWPDSNFESYNKNIQNTGSQESAREYIFNKYLDYYSTFAGCKIIGENCSNGAGNITPVSVCDSNGFLVSGAGVPSPSLCISNVTTGRAPHNPCYLAQQEENRYVSAVADNITLVTFDKVIESETLYDIEPGSVSFDRATRQRYGSTFDANIFLDTRQGDVAWSAEQLPEARVIYFEQGPDVNGDLAAFIGGATTAPEFSDAYQYLDERYFKEEHPMGGLLPISDCLKAEATDDDCLLGTIVTPRCSEELELTNKESLICDPNLQYRRRQELPGWKQLYGYYSAPAVDPNFPIISQTLLTCSQLAEAQLRDPRHNALIQTYDPDKDIYSRLSGDRLRIAQDHNRICQWVGTVDRQGRLAIYGLNYRGQQLVEGLRQESNDWLFSEQVYNADGLPIQLRNSTLNDRRWNKDKGYTAIIYDDVDPNGYNGWNEWKLAWWAARANILEVRTYPDLSQHPTLSGAWSGTGGASTKVVKFRFQKFTYEPLFNQIHTTTTGEVYTNNTIKFFNQTINDFDYQEFDYTSEDFRQALISLKSWAWRTPQGYHLEDSGFHDWVAWVVSVQSYNADLNNDNVIGFPNYSNAQGNRIKGFVVRRMIRDLTQTSGREAVNHYIPAPHGMPAHIMGPGGSHVQLKYYTDNNGQRDNLSQFGPVDLSMPVMANTQWRGMLASVQFTKMPATVAGEAAPPLNEGPTSGTAFSVPCSNIDGPYRWVLPVPCADPSEQLQHMGVPQELADKIIAVSTSTTSSDLKHHVTRFHYNPSGHLAKTWRDGSIDAWKHDADGRILEHIDARGARTRHYFDTHRQTIKIRIDLGGTILTETSYYYDDEGNIIGECASVTGPCPQASEFAYDLTRTTEEPIYLLTTRRYSPEGELYSELDSMGVESKYTRNTIGLITNDQTFIGTSLQRQTTYSYDNENFNLINILYGTPAIRQTAPIDESFSYDGFNRIVKHMDQRQTYWVYLYDGLDQVVASRQSDKLYGQSLLTLPIQEKLSKTDGLGLVTHRKFVGTISNQTTSYDQLIEYGSQFLPVKVTSTGKDPVWMSYDALGQRVWTKDSYGNQYLSFHDHQQRKYTTARIMRHSQSTGYDLAADYLTTTFEQQYDAGGLLLSSKTTGHNAANGMNTAEVMQTSYEHDALGRVTEETRHDGTTSAYEYNRVGWLKQSHEQQAHMQSGMATTQYTHNAYGQVRNTIDPSGQTILRSYTALGQLAQINLPLDGSRAFNRFEYDGHGRRARSFLHTASGSFDEIEHKYDVRGDLYELRWNNFTGSTKALMSYQYDDLGRITAATNNNLRLMALLGHTTTAATRVRTQYQYDALGRIGSETTRVPNLSGVEQVLQTQSSWGIDPFTKSWQRTLTYPSGLIDTQRYDGIGRMAQSARVQNQVEYAVDYHWTGNIYTGRDQETVPGLEQPDPFRERRTLDGFGKMTSLEYSALDLDAPGGDPLNSSWSDVYCAGTSWSPAACRTPLARMEFKYDSMGRLASQRASFGNPLINVSTGELATNQTHHDEWRGYTYSARGFLQREWHNSAFNENDYNSLLNNHTITPSQLAAVGDVGGSGTEWIWSREQEVGGLTAIVNAANSSQIRWKHLNPDTPDQRLTGHRLKQVKLGTVTRTIEHDGRGRVIVDGRHEYIFDPLDRLTAAASQASGQLSEHYLYDHAGRLARVWSNIGSGELKTYSYDGLQIIEGYTGGQLSWDARWGSQLDQLVEWRDHTDSTTKTYTPLRNFQNSIIALWNNEEARLTHTARYDAHGRVTLLLEDESVGCEEGLTGQLCDHLDTAFPFGFNTALRSSMTGLYSMRARWYSPELGQFMSLDPLGSVDSFNMYAFTAFDPINYWDPMGQSSRYFSRMDKLIIGIDDTMRAVTGANKDAGDALERAVQPDHTDEGIALIAKAAAVAGIAVWREMTPQNEEEGYEALAENLAGGITGKIVNKGAKAARVIIKKGVKTKRAPKKVKSQSPPNSPTDPTKPRGGLSEEEYSRRSDEARIKGRDLATTLKPEKGNLDSDFQWGTPKRVVITKKKTSTKDVLPEEVDAISDSVDVNDTYIQNLKDKGYTKEYIQAWAETYEEITAINPPIDGKGNMSAGGRARLMNRILKKWDK